MFVYHACPAEMLGVTLYPLADLKILYPKLYARERSKYDDHPARKRIPWARVAKLECSRQETLNFAPIHPHLIYRAWADLGVTLPSALWFRIPVERFAELPAVVFVPSGAVGDDIPDADVRWFDPRTYYELTLPPATLEWYRELHTKGKRGAWFARVPHVLVNGPVSVAGLEPFDWSVPWGACPAIDVPAKLKRVDTYDAAHMPRFSTLTASASGTVSALRLWIRSTSTSISTT